MKPHFNLVAGVNYDETADCQLKFKAVDEKAASKTLVISYTGLAYETNYTINIGKNVKSAAGGLGRPSSKTVPSRKAEAGSVMV